MTQEEIAKQQNKGIEKTIILLSTLIGVNVAIVSYTENGVTGAFAVGILLLGIYVVTLSKMKDYKIRTMINSFFLSGWVIARCLMGLTMSESLPLFFTITAMAGLYGIAKNLLPTFLTAVFMSIFYGISCEHFGTEVLPYGVLILVYEFVLFIWLKGRGKMQIQAMNTIRALRIAEQTKDDFLANVSHELRTPLNTITGMSDMIMDEQNIEKIHDHTYAIQTASKNLMQIVSDILDFSELQTGNVELEEEEYTITNALDEIVGIATVQKGDKDVNILTDLDKKMPSVLKGDIQRISRIVMNLVGNAIKFTDKGYVRIRVGGQENEDGYALTISVEDSGIGISPEGIEKIFSLKGQLDTGVNRRNGGIGLGLAITQVLLKKMNGELNIASKPGKGSIFKIVIPQVIVDRKTIEEKQAKKSIPKKHHQKFIAPTAKILVVDDNKMNLKVIEGLLKKYQIQVVAAMSGMEALEVIESKDFDFVFMDHMMPEMDGLETLHRLRAKGEAYYQNVPVIALTANAVPGAKEMFLAAGCADFVEKPVRLPVLEKALLDNLPEEKIEDVEEPETQKQETIVPLFEKKEVEKPRDENAIGDLDMKTALTYCGDEEKLIEILVTFCDGAKETRINMVNAYEKEDVTNYTIYVHALKSSMNSIGAMKLSAMAKELEQAGKENDMSYIQDHHHVMLKEFDRVIDMLTQEDKVKDKLTKEEIAKIDPNSLKEIQLKQWEEMCLDFERAAYSLDEPKMKEILGELKECRMGMTPLVSYLVKIEKKVEQSDYISASEALNKAKEEVSNETKD